MWCSTGAGSLPGGWPLSRLLWLWRPASRRTLPFTSGCPRVSLRRGGGFALHSGNPTTSGALLHVDAAALSVLLRDACLRAAAPGPHDWRLVVQQASASTLAAPQEMVVWFSCQRCHVMIQLHEFALLAFSRCSEPTGLDAQDACEGGDPLGSAGVRSA